MKKKSIIGLIIVIMVLCVCLVACDKTSTVPDNQTNTKDISNLVNENDKFSFSFDDYIKTIDDKSAHFHFILDVNYAKLSNYQELLEQFGLSETYENEEERSDDYYRSFCLYYSNYIDDYFPNAWQYSDYLLSWRETPVTFVYSTLEAANNNYDNLLRLAEREEIVGIHILARAGLYE